MTWEMVPLGDLGAWSGGGTPSKSRPDYWDGDIPWLSPKDMGGLVLSDTQDHISTTAVAESSTKLVPACSVAIVTRSGILEHTLPSVYVPFDVTLNQDMKALTPRSGLDPKWVLYGLRAFEREILTTCRKTGTTVASIEWQRFAHFRLPVPSLAEQRRIVELVEEHLSHLDAADAALDSTRTRAQALGSAALQQIVSEVEGDSQLVNLGELARISSGTTPSRENKSFWENGLIPWITSGDLSAEDIYESRQCVTTAALETTSLKMFPSGTLLVAMYGEGKTRGTVAELHIPATINQACAAIQLHEPAVRSWVRLVLEANYSAMRKLAVGGVQPNLNQGLIRNIPIPMPEPDLRQAVLAKTDVLRSGAARLKTQADTAKARSATLRRAVLAAAFSGRLTGSSSDTEVIEEAAAGLAPHGSGELP